MTDTLVTEHTPRLDSGHGLRTYAIARALASERPLDVVYVPFGAGEVAPEYLDRERFRLRRIDSSRGLRRAVLYARARAAGVPRGFARGISPELVDAIAAGAGGRVIADGPVVGAAAMVAGRADFEYCAHNLESAFRLSVADGDLGSEQTLRRFERRLLDRARESWMASERDMELARELAPGARLRHVPNAIDVAAIDPVAADSESRRAVFVGSFDYEPNRRALRFMLEEVMPRVWQTVPDARLRLVGRGLPAAVSADERVEVLGYVEDIRDAYVGCAAVAVPLLEGGGSPLKFVEALAYGLPVVATPAAAAGLAVEPDRDYAEGNGPDGFATALSSALAQSAGRPTAGGRRLVERSYSVEAVVRALAT